MAARSLLCLLLTAGTAVIADNARTYPSRPNLRAPSLDVSINPGYALTPGYIFVTPRDNDQPGPYIYDTQGNLVWSGRDATNGNAATNLQVANYQNRQHLYFFQSNSQFPQDSRGQGQGVIMDDSYTVVRTVQAGNGRQGLDGREFKILDGGTVLVSVYQPLEYDVGRFGISTGRGWVLSGMFQEIRIDTGEVLFEWNSLDFVDPSTSYVTPNSRDGAGDGLSPNTAWDYFHITSVDKTPDGDYLVSSRHTSTVYKVSRVDKTVVWRLGGQSSTVALQGFSFSFQHDVRFRGQNGDVISLSLFDNGADQRTRNTGASSGKIIDVDTRGLTARLVAQFNPPSGNQVSESGGSVQLVQNGNVVVGWGSASGLITEHTRDGAVVWSASLGDPARSYKAIKFDWSATPRDTPSLYARADSNIAPTTFYMSWNGATRVATYQVYSSDAAGGQFSMAAVVPKTGGSFETTATVPGFVGNAYVTALDAAGNVVGTQSAVVQTVVGQGLPQGQGQGQGGWQNPTPGQGGQNWQSPWQGNGQSGQNWQAPWQDNGQGGQNWQAPCQGPLCARGRQRLRRRRGLA
ncbi:MAG: hypothetical protein M1832_003889 [Thelocarpon impressellum]|nr:MAG: hypothetical protein M1832_003889 [Thelocarpon impressellum]